jgi:hypothetical protein
MVYKIGTITDLATLPPMDNTALELVYYHASVLTHEYGANRNVNESDGGFVLYATPGTNVKDIKAFFDISKHSLEYVNTYGSLCEVAYLLNNDFVVTIIMSIADAPAEILNETN